MTDIATFAVVPAPTATKLIDGMVADNLVYRRTDVHDRRRVLVFPTPRGRALHQRLAVAIDQMPTVGFISQRDTQELAVLLDRLIATMDARAASDPVPDPA